MQNSMTTVSCWVILFFVLFQLIFGKLRQNLLKQQLQMLYETFFFTNKVV